MSYAKMLKELFQGVTLNVEDLLFLESFQIKYLPDRVPKQEFAVLLRANPIIHRYFISMCPSINAFIDEILAEQITNNNRTIDENCNELLWEIGDLIVYNKYPEVYDANIKFVWDIDEIISTQLLKGKVAVDVGAGPGKLALEIAKYAATVFAVEPVRGFRQFIKEKASRENVKNLFTADGFLDSIPFPDNSVDVLMTSEAIGWNLVDELREVERIVKPNGYVIHLFKNADADVEAGKKFHNLLTSSEYNYECKRFQDTSRSKLKYHKTMN